MIGDGCAETNNSGLSDFGRTVIREMNRIGVIIDLAHSGMPVIASHFTCYSLNKHYRGKSDEVISAEDITIWTI
jgi:membrane dipeptidase